MIFYNPAGAPELGCDHCGCRWYDRMTNACYECGEAVTPQMLAEFEQALKDFQAKKDRNGSTPSPAGGRGLG